MKKAAPDGAAFFVAGTAMGAQASGSTSWNALMVIRLRW
ncbi:hypothetical protein FHS63_004169 [Azospirillum doebereinerae]